MNRLAKAVAVIGLAAFVAACEDQGDRASAQALEAAGCFSEDQLKAGFVQQMSATGSGATYDWISFQLGPPGPRSAIDERPARSVLASYRKVAPDGTIQEDVSAHEMRFYVTDFGECRFDTLRYEWDWHPQQGG